MKGPSPKAGDRVSEYVLEEKLGAGGFGEVWKAVHAHLPGEVAAIKIPTEPAFIENMKREGRILARVRGPHVVDVKGLDPFAEPPYLVMEYVDGKNLRQLIRDAGKVPAADAAVLFRQALEGLKSAHDQGVIHRDVKPENILIDADGDVKITDFGLGRATEATASAVLLSGAASAASAQGIAGTVRYMSPEQREGGRVDARTDLYSLGVVLFEMLTGDAPQGAELPSDVDPSLPAWCDQVFSKCYTRLERRFGSASEALSALCSLVPGLDAGASAPAAQERSPKPVEAIPLPPAAPAARRGRPLWMWPFLAVWAVFDGIGRAARDLARPSRGGGAAGVAIGSLVALSVIGVVVLAGSRKKSERAMSALAGPAPAESIEESCRGMVSAWKNGNLAEVWGRLSDEARAKIAYDDGWDVRSHEWKDRGWRLLEGILSRYPRNSPPQVLSGLERASTGELMLMKQSADWYTVNAGDVSMEWVRERGSWKMARSGLRPARR